jgi:hypothetical protein
VKVEGRYEEKTEVSDKEEFFRRRGASNVFDNDNVNGGRNAIYLAIGGVAIKTKISQPK